VDAHKLRATPGLRPGRHNRLLNPLPHAPPRAPAQADLSLRDLLGGPSTFVPRAASLVRLGGRRTAGRRRRPPLRHTLPPRSSGPHPVPSLDPSPAQALFQALGNWRGSSGGGAASADKAAAAAPAAAEPAGPPARRTRSATGKGAPDAGLPTGRGAKRPAPALELCATPAGAGADEDDDDDLMLPLSTGARSGSFLRSFLGVGPLGFGSGSLTDAPAGGGGGDGGSGSARGGGGGGAFTSLAKTQLGDMLRSIRSFTGRSGGSGNNST
jgi:hypothetical protein